MLVQLVVLWATSVNSDLVRRLNEYGKCLESQSEEANALIDSLIANEYDRRQPLSIAFFGSNQAQLQINARQLIHSLFLTELAPAVHTMDILQEIKSSDCQENLRHQIAIQLTKCSDRSLFLVDNMQLISIPTLDVFLDPLTGQRALVRAKTGEILDGKNAIFLFLFHIPNDDILQLQDWKMYLEKLWQHSEPTFTPSALIGRLSEGVIFRQPVPDHCVVVEKAAVKAAFPSWTVIGLICMIGIVITVLVWTRKVVNVPTKSVPAAAATPKKTKTITPNKRRRSTRNKQKKS